MKNYQKVVVKDLKDHQNVLIKDLKDHFIGINIKQKVISEIQQTNLDVLLEWIANKKW